MELSDEEIREFQQIWKDEFKEDIDFNQAAEKATYVFEFYKAVYLPIDEDEVITSNENEYEPRNQS